MEGAPVVDATEAGRMGLPLLLEEEEEEEEHVQESGDLVWMTVYTYR